MAALKKEEFCEAIEQIRDFYDFTEALKELKGVEEFPRKEAFIDSYLRTLIAAMDDVETEDNQYSSWIVQYCWEYDFGRALKPAPTINGETVKFSTSEDLYKVLVKEE